MPIFRVKSVKIYTGQKKFTRAPLVVLVTNIRYAMYYINYVKQSHLSQGQAGPQQWGGPACWRGPARAQPVARSTCFIFLYLPFFYLSFDQPANPLQLELGLLQPLLVARVHDEDDRVRGARVRPPEGPRLVLPSDVPDVEDPT